MRPSGRDLRLRWGRVEVGGGLLFWAALLWYLDCGAVLASFLSAAALHELGHVAAVRQCGGTVRRLRLGLLGAELVLDGRERLSYGREFWAAAAGPLANLVTGVLAAQLWRAVRIDGLLLFAGASLVLGSFNLLPLDPLDGGQMLRLLLTALWSPAAGAVLSGAVSRLVTAGLLAAGVWLLWKTRYNASLLAVALWAAVSPAEQTGMGPSYLRKLCHRMGQTQRRRRS